MKLRTLETCFSPALFNPDEISDSIVVIIDILRASSSICTAFANGVSSIIPVAGIAEAKEYKEKGYIVAAERDGIKLDFADLGNSPYNFSRDNVEGKTIVYSTTNGTGIINISLPAYKTVIGSFLNIGALSAWLKTQDKNVILFCAGWKGRFNLEDSVCAGAIAEKLLSSNLYSTICDSTLAAIDLWTIASDDLEGYIGKAAHYARLKARNLDDCVAFCLTCDFTDKVPVMKNGILVENVF